MDVVCAPLFHHQWQREMTEINQNQAGGCFISASTGRFAFVCRISIGFVFIS
jgi:hypothetical protein